MRAPAIVAAVALVLPGLAGAADRNRYEIEATVAKDLGTIEGEVRARIVNDTGAPVDVLTLWLFPNVFAREPAGVTAVNREYYQPAGPGRGGAEVSEVTVAGRPAAPVPIDVPPAPHGTAFLLPLGATLAPGDAALVALRFHTGVPERLGPLNTDRRSLTAMGGWHPYFTAGDARTPGADRRPPDASFRVTVRPPPNFLALIGRDPGPAAVLVGPFAPLWVRPPAVRPILTKAGRVWPLRNRPERGDGCSFPDPAAIPGEWTGDELAEVLRKVDDWADERGLPDPGPIDLFVVPLASELALATGGGVAVSNRFYSVPPLDIVRHLHDRALARAILAERLLPWVRAREEPGNVPQVADALGSYLAARFLEEVEGSTADVTGLLSVLDFVPSLDAFLRSPKSAFPHVYFRPITEPMPVRDEPWTFNVTAPRGNLPLEKTIDWIGEPAMARAIAVYLAPDAPAIRSFVDALSGITEKDLAPFWRAWNQRIYREDLRVHRLEELRAPDGHRTRVLVERVGDAPPELIEVAVEDGTAATQILQWRAEEGERSRAFDVVTAEPVARLRVDPRRRVTQAAIDRSEVPALGDVDPVRLQLLITKANFTYSVPDRSPYGEFEAVLRRRDDVRRRYGLGAAYRPARVGGRSYVSFGFGPLIDAARYAFGATIGIEGDFLRRGFGDEETRSGWALGPTFGVGFDDRPPVPNADRGNAWALSTSVNLGSSGGSDPVAYAGLGIGGIHLEPLGRGHVLALRFRGAGLTGTPPIQELLPLGGTDEGLRGITLEEVLGERRVVGGVEWRIPLLRTLDQNLVLGRLRSVGGALFAEGAWMDDIRRADGAETSIDHAWFGGVGAGLRIRTDFLGVQPLVLSVDGTVPMGRLNAAGKSPVTVVFRVGQAFTSP